MSPEGTPLPGIPSPDIGRVLQQVLTTKIPPPNLRLVACCTLCRYGRPEGISVECRRFQTNGISLYAICDLFEARGSGEHSQQARREGERA